MTSISELQLEYQSENTDQVGQYCFNWFKIKKKRESLDKKNSTVHYCESTCFLVFNAVLSTCTVQLFVPLATLCLFVLLRAN